MKSYEQKLYDAITESAKKADGFDYTTFRASFNAMDYEHAQLMSDNVIWYVINNALIKTSKEKMAYELLNQFMVVGLKVDIEFFKTFIADKDEVFKKQIAVAKLATDMLNNNVDEFAVYSNMIDLLN